MKVIKFRRYETNNHTNYENVQPIETRQFELNIKNIWRSENSAASSAKKDATASTHVGLRDTVHQANRTTVSNSDQMVSIANAFASTLPKDGGISQIKTVGLKKFQNLRVEVDITNNVDNLDNMSGESSEIISSEPDTEATEPIPNSNNPNRSLMPVAKHCKSWYGTTEFNMEKVKHVFADGCDAEPIQDLKLFSGFKGLTKHIMIQKPQLRPTHAYAWPNLIQKKSLILIDDFEKIIAYLPVICSLVHVGQ